jgi:ATP-dependent Lon protease
MTGEMTLSGRVLAIGGVKEKVLGAARAGISAIVLPKQNEADLEDLPQEVRDRLEFHFVDELGEVLELAIREGRSEPQVYSKAGSDRPLSSDLEH